MLFKKISRDTCSDSSSPCLIDPTITGLCYHGHVNHYPDNTNAMYYADESLPETFRPINVTPNFEQLKYNREAPPPYKEDYSPQKVWTSEMSKVHPGNLTIIGQNKRRRGVFCRKLLRFLIVALGAYLCFSALSILVINYGIAQNLRTVQTEALQAVNVVRNISYIPPEYEGTLIHATGLISVTAPLRYEECEISAHSVKLKREIDTSRAFSRSEYQPYTSNNRWSDYGLDKENICERQDLKLVSLDDDEKIAGEARIGSLVLGHRIKEKLSYNHFIPSKLMILDDYRAFRVTYTDAGRNGEKYSVMGQLVNDTIQPYELLDYYTIILINDFEVPAENMILYRVNDHMETLNAENWNAYLKIGMLVPLTAMFYFMGFAEAAKKYKHNRLMLGVTQ